MTAPEARLVGTPKPTRRFTRLLFFVGLILAFCAVLSLIAFFMMWRTNNWGWPFRYSTPISRMMEGALPEGVSGAKLPEDAPQPSELAFVRSVAAPDDWVCYFWDWEPVTRTIQRETGRKISANVTRADDQRAWAIVIGERAHVMPIWSSYVRDERESAPPPTYRRCTRSSATRVLKQGSYLVIQDAV